MNNVGAKCPKKSRNWPLVN